MDWRDRYAGSEILVADDMPFSRSMIARFLERPDGPRLSYVDNGADALAELDSDAGRDIHLLVTDFYMPVINGLDLVLRIRSGRTAARYDMAVVMVTSEADSTLTEAAGQFDVDAVLVKPISRGALNGAVDAALARSGLRRSPQDYAAAEIPALGRWLDSESRCGARRR
jgi:two-component system chemotaxis response regulator CheY